MRVAISQRVTWDERGTRRDSLEQDYVNYYSKFGINLIPVSNTLPSVTEFLSSLNPDGIILSGGNDIDPSLYGGSRKESSSFAPERDKTERELVDYALEKKLPVLAQCRGAQFLNVFYGGKLRKVDNHVATTHKILINSPHIKETENQVNSFHDFGIIQEDLSDELKVFAETPEGVVEGFYHEKFPVAGILWHPERASSSVELDGALVEAFVKRRWFWSK